ncbi:MAG: CPBP family glutamic-type intramembrane protease [Rubricoccaceae bacterium]
MSDLSPREEAERAAREIERLANPDPQPTAGTVSTPPTGYWAVTKSATYAFWAALPLFVLYEVGIVLANGGVGSMGQVRVGADVWIKSLLNAIGWGGGIMLGVVVLALGVTVWWRERHRRPPLVPKYFGGILVESLLYAVVLAFLVSGAVGALFGSWALPDLALAQMSEFGLGLQLALSIGAGLYEELVFRVLLVGGLFLAIDRFTKLDRTKAYIIAALVGAVVFSAVHHMGSFGDPFTLSVFTFRFLFGLALNAVFLLRGFAVAAWTHAIYDVLVVTGSFN